ncbi:MAG: DUF1848 family protein, partial [Alphaproteobacteria bacterium]|nr:DUF1848 family protein [Alphaproteobacteria bacterium]
ITGYPRALEKSVPNAHKAIQTFRALSAALGPGRVVWRYDPVLVCNLVDVAEHKRLFAKIAAGLEGATERVIVSFADFYKKTARNLKAVPGLETVDVVERKDALHDLAGFMAETAGAHGMTVQSCAEDVDLDRLGIGHGKCIDDALLNGVFGLSLGLGKDKNQRKACGCVESVDIGAYNTCLHGCVYCYATENKTLAAKNAALHDPASPFQVGRPGPGEDDQPLLL